MLQAPRPSSCLRFQKRVAYAYNCCNKGCRSLPVALGFVRNTSRMTGDQRWPSVKVLDGGLGTELERADGCDLLDHPLWSAKFLHENPTAVKEAHKRFLLAGSNAVITASYQASVKGLVKYCNVTPEKARSLIQSSVSIAKDAIKEVESSSSDKKDFYVAASVGPRGALLHDMSEYNGKYVDDMTIEQLKDWHRERITLLLSQDPDYLAIETMPALKEVLAILDILKEFPHAKAWVTFTCKDTVTTFHDDNFVESVKTVVRCPQVKSVGVNCCQPQIVQELINSVKHLLSTNQTFIVYPNHGLRFKNGRWVEDTSVDISTYVPLWLESGVVEWVGGCCNTFPQYISDVAEAVHTFNSRNGI